MSFLTQEQCNALLVNGILATSEFERFLRERELHHLQTYEPEFVGFAATLAVHLVAEQ